MFKNQFIKVAKTILSFFLVISLFSFVDEPEKSMRKGDKSDNKKIIVDIGIYQPNVENCDPSSIDESNKLNHIQVFPNPSDGLFLLMFSDYFAENSDLLVVDVFDLNGKLVYSKNIHSTNNPLKIDLSFLDMGMYFMQVHNSAVSNYSKIIIK